MTDLVYDLRGLDHAVSSGNGVLKSRDMVQLDEARSLILAAEKEAEKIRSKAQEHYLAEKERGYQEGRQEAEQDALSRLLAEQVHLNSKLKELESDLADVVKSCVRKIITTFDDLSLAETAASAALQKMRNERHIQIYLPPSLMEGFAEFATRLETQFPDAKTIELIEDTSLNAPDIIVESRIGRIECGLGNNIAEVEAIIDAAAANIAANVNDHETGEAQ